MDHAPSGRGHRIATRLLLPLAVIFAALAVLWTLFAPLRVEGDSMLPGLHDGDRALVTRFYARASRGDVVHIDGFGPDGTTEGRYVKRVIAIEGDRVRIEFGRALVNDGAEQTAAPLLTSDADVSLGEITVPPGHVYVLGDNRPVSLDSRFYGPVPLEAVAGRLVLVFAPVTRAGAVD